MVAGTGSGEATLNDQEREMLRLWTRGYQDSEIATALSVDGPIVEARFRDLQRKVGVSDRLDLVLHILAGSPERISAAA
jgi:DNA-binding CsgD family transcriptional regulator